MNSACSSSRGPLLSCSQYSLSELFFLVVCLLMLVCAAYWSLHSHYLSSVSVTLLLYYCGQGWLNNATSKILRPQICDLMRLDMHGSKQSQRWRVMTLHPHRLKQGQIHFSVHVWTALHFMLKQTWILKVDGKHSLQITCPNVPNPFLHPSKQALICWSTEFCNDHS